MGSLTCLGRSQKLLEEGLFMKAQGWLLEIKLYKERRSFREGKITKAF